MDVTPLIRRDTQIIQSYRGGAFKVSGVGYTNSILILPDQVLEVPDLNDLVTLLLSVRDRIEVFLYGTGDRFVMPSPDFKRRIKEELGLSAEPMDNGAAARTYNVLMAEGRKVAVLLTKAA